MSQWHCLSNTFLRRARWLSGLAGAALLSGPALADGAADLHYAPLPTEVTIAPPVITEPAADHTISSAAGCSPVRLADAAMIAPAAAPSMGKASAILGGEISSLDRIRLTQSGAPMPATEAIPVMAVLAARFENNDAPHSELTRPETSSEGCYPRPKMAAAAPSVPNDQLILGSLRLSIRTTPFDQNWRGVSQAPSARGLKRWLVRTGASGAVGLRAQVAAINSWVNNKIAYTDDLALYRKNDFWAASRETLRRGKGDCEDYAILKMDLLAAMGIERDKMILVVARDLVRNADHAVLVVQLDDGPLVLDNSTDILRDGRLANDYRPIMSFASNGKWLHGYAVATAAPQPAPLVPAPVETIAALSVPSAPANLLSTRVSASN